LDADVKKPFVPETIIGPVLPFPVTAVIVVEFTIVKEIAGMP
jgi:hypothetical protein